jgi:lipooligosaccharide transport system permease protein
MNPWRLPRLRSIHGALALWRRNLYVWRKLLIPAILMNFGEPALYLLGLGLGLGRFVGELGGLSYLGFLASGMVVSSAMTTASFEGMYSVYTRMEPQRTYQALLATPLEVDDIVAGEMLWCATKALFSGAAILLVAALLGEVAGPRALLALPVIFLTGLCFAGPAILMSAIAPGYDFFNYYFVLLITPMFLLCGVFYPIDTLPAAMQQAVQFLPLTHAVELARPLVTGGVPAQPGLNLGVLLGYTLAGGYLATRLMRRRLWV